ncbi:MAG: DUF1109 family protein, partial [Rhizobiales bacterium]|nr:DUF1109 family protein [Hyphomicrobiales bacterium]
METNDLIKAIARDAAAPRLSLGLLLLGACGLASVIAAVVFSTLLGPRPDFAEAAHTARFLLKFVITATLAVTALFQVAELARPNSRPRRRGALLAIAPAILLAAILMEIATIPTAEWGARLVGTNSLICLTMIPLIGLGPLAVLLAA